MRERAALRFDSINVKSPLLRVHLPHLSKPFFRRSPAISVSAMVRRPRAVHKLSHLFGLLPPQSREARPPLMHLVHKSTAHPVAQLIPFCEAVFDDAREVAGAMGALEVVHVVGDGVVAEQCVGSEGHVRRAGTLKLVLLMIVLVTVRPRRDAVLGRHRKLDLIVELLEDLHELPEVQPFR